MIKHIVMFKFAAEAEGRTARENAQLAAQMLEGLKGVVPSLRHSEVRLNSPGACQDNCELVLISDFDDLEGLNSYIVHPEHRKVGEFMKGVRLSRSCVDYEY